ncbi:hypothetical protein CsatB_021827 [Cannabis sativa]
MLKELEIMYYLPPFGQLPLLKDLSISRCNSVVTVGAEFYGNCSARKPFSSLETLRFRYMSSWEKGHPMQTKEATTYGKLKTLEIARCPKLVGDLPGFLPSLISIKIMGGKQYPLLSLPILPCVTNMRIEKLENWDDYFEVISVSDGKSLEELTSLSIRNCGSFVSFPNDELIAPKLSSLRIANCRKLKWLLEKTTILSALNELEIIDCPLLEPFPEDARERSLPVTLSSLVISYDELLRMKSNWETLPHPTYLSISGNEEDMESFSAEGLLPTTITSLSISFFSKLRGLDKNGPTQLTSLQTLGVLFCPELETLSEEGFPTSLTSLSIHRCPLVKKKYDPKESGNEEYWNNISHVHHVIFS